jgi:hypothetical protein
LAREPIERVERMHWRLLVEFGWDSTLGDIAHSPIPKNFQGQDRIDFYKARADAQRRLTVFFPEDE